MECAPDNHHDSRDESPLHTQAIAGDRGALNAIFHRYRDVAYRVAYRLLGHESDALDPVQDGFFNAFRKIDQFRQECRFRTWLLRIVSNAALDIGRKRARQSSVMGAQNEITSVSGATTPTFDAAGK